MCEEINEIDEIAKIKVKVHFDRQFFPKDKPIKNGDYGIVTWKVDEVIEGCPELHPHFQTITIKGTMCEIEKDEIYTVIAKESPSDKGMQYDLLYMGQPSDLSSIEDQRVFLSRILTDKQVQQMFNTFESPIDIIKNGDTRELTKIKGIGDITAQRIIDKYELTKDYSKLYVELDGYGLTNAMIGKLLSRYSSPEVVISKIKENPYILATEVDGVGFLTADKMALEHGLEWDNPNRVEAFVLHRLEEEAQNGNSYIRANDLMYNIEDVLGDVPKEHIGQAVNELVEKKRVGLDEVTDGYKRVYLNKYKNLERKVSNELLRILNGENSFKSNNWEQKVRELEDRQGWTHTIEQWEGIRTVLENQVVVITGGAGCVDADTEFFNGIEWKRIADYEEGDMVLQYHENGDATLVKPEEYVKYREDNLTLIETERGGINQCLSDEHNVVYITSKNNLQKKPFHEVREMHENSKKGFYGRFITTFNYNGEGVSFSDEDIRVMVAVIADGHFANNTNRCRVNLKRQDKKIRLEKLLEDANIEYTKRIGYTEGYHIYHFQAPRREKEFESYWYSCSNEQLKVVTDEVLKWDGSEKGVRRRFSSTSKKSIDFIQFAYSSTGARATVMTNDRVGQQYMTGGKEHIRKSIEYGVSISRGSKLISIQCETEDKKLKFKPYKTIDGYKYCFTVPTSMLVLRREGRIFITGNTGKSTVVRAMLEALGDSKGDCNFAQTALSGRASAKLQEVTGEDGKTIHRLLEFNPFDGFVRNEMNQLEEDLIVLDEISLVGGHIFLDLIKAIKTGSKLILLGDDGQLPSIGCMNLAQDLINSKSIPTVTLTKIHRQAQKSGIITESIKMRHGEQSIERSFSGRSIRGELQDFEFDISIDKEDIKERVVNHFKKWYNKLNNIMDVQIIVPIKSRGECCVEKVNNDIQEIYNPKTKIKRELRVVTNKKKDEGYILREKDKVIVTKNNYKTVDIYGEDTPIFNGWIGILEEISDSYLAISFPMISKTVLISTKQVDVVKLGYANTVHSLQGSSAKVIIGALDYTTPPLMRTRELVYTLVTRAEEYCVLVAQNGAFREAVETSFVSEKNTFLKEMIDGEI